MILVMNYVNIESIVKEQSTNFTSPTLAPTTPITPSSLGIDEPTLGQETDIEEDSLAIDAPTLEAVAI